MVGFYISASITGVIYILEFLFAFLEKETIRKSLKPFCLTGLIVTLAFFGLRNWMVYVALGFGLVGDIILIFEDKKICFLGGIIAFFVDHVFNIIVMSTLLEYAIPVWVTIGLSVLGCLFPLLVYKMLHQYMGKLTIPGGMYFYILFMEFLFAVLLINNLHTPYAWLVLIGNVFFIVSDSLISISHFMVDIKRREFYIMSTYLIAQTLIGFGLCLLL